MTSLWTELPRSSGPIARRPPGLLRQSLALLLLRTPAGPARPGSVWLVLAAASVFMLGGALVDDLMIAAPRALNPWAFSDRSLPLLIALLAATLVCLVLRRPQLITRVAATGLLAVAPVAWAWPWLSSLWPDHTLIQRLPGLYAVLIALQTVRWLHAGAVWPRRALATVGSALLLSMSFNFLPYSSWWWNEDVNEDPDGELHQQTQLSISPEQLWSRQGQLLDEAAERLAPQRAGQVDLYALGIAGDGSESVFRNEVDYFAQLMEQRFDSPGRVLRLINHPQSIETTPLATVSNLTPALQAIARRMDVDEDLLMLFLTSHGSEDHQFYLGLDPLPLDDLDPQTLRSALDASGIRWRVVVVSACYSGGFVEALRSPETLVITAARADRPSFGCGAQSDITWFGQAFLSEALNEETDLFAAFRIAKQRVRERETEQDERPSYPQIDRGSAIGAKLDTWRAQLRPGPPIPFSPTRP